MKKFGFFLSIFLLTTFVPNNLIAYQSSLFWTTCTTDVMPTGFVDFQTANYFTVFTNTRSQAFPPDIALLLGLLTWHDWKVEVGIDYLGGTNNPWFFCGKVGIEEDKLFSKAPGFSIGVFDLGTRAGITNFNIFDVVIGKTLPDKLGGGRCFLGAYIGSSTLNPNQGGYMAGYLQSFCSTIDCKGVKYWKWYLAADYASGENFIGGGGVGIYYFFNPNTSLVTGPTWFNDAEVNGRWKWTIQTNFVFPVFDSKKTW